MHTQPPRLCRALRQTANVILLGITVGLNSMVWGQATSEPPKRAKNAENSVQALETTPFEAPAIGLKINFPAGSTVTAQKVNNQVVVMATDDLSTPAWTLRIQPLTSTVEKPTAASQIQALLNDYKAQKQPFEVISNSPFTVGRQVGQLCFIEQTVREQKMVSGWLLLRTGETTFMVFSIQTLPEHMSRVRPLLEASFATIELRSIAEITAERKTKLDAGRALLDSITPEQLKALVGTKQWVRLYQPGASEASPAVEVGYSLLEVLEAKRGEVDPSRKEKDYKRDDKKTGLMIRVQGRIAVQPERQRYYDSIALYWMAWDQSEEIWNIIGTDRQGDAEVSEAENGVRAPYVAGAPHVIVVVKSNNATNDRKTYHWEVPEVYLSQALQWILPRVLPKDVREEREYNYHFYNFANRAAQLSQRSDVWGPANDGAGNFRLFTKLASDSPPITSIYNSNGELVKRTMADGTITEPATVENIHKIWKNKGLDVGKAKAK